MSSVSFGLGLAASVDVFACLNKLLIHCAVCVCSIYLFSLSLYDDYFMQTCRTYLLTFHPLLYYLLGFIYEENFIYLYCTIKKIMNKKKQHTICAHINCSCFLLHRTVSQICQSERRRECEREKERENDFRANSRHRK